MNQREADQYSGSWHSLLFLFVAANSSDAQGCAQAGFQNLTCSCEVRFYELTSKGQTHLKVETENWTRLTDLVSLILEGTLEGI